MGGDDRPIRSALAKGMGVRPPWLRQPTDPVPDAPLVGAAAAVHVPADAVITTMLPHPIHRVAMDYDTARQTPEHAAHPITNTLTLAELYAEDHPVVQRWSERATRWLAKDRRESVQAMARRLGQRKVLIGLDDPVAYAERLEALIGLKPGALDPALFTPKLDLGGPDRGATHRANARDGELRNRLRNLAKGASVLDTVGRVDA